MKKKVNSGNSSLLMSIVEIVIGVLLLINPVGLTSVIIIALGVAMAVMGIVQIIGYFRTDAQEASKGNKLSKGILFLVLGLFCAFKSGWFIATFPVITILYGILIMVAGVCKLQQAVDMVRVKQKYWFVALISAMLTLLFAALIIFNPFASTTVLWTFTGITLIIEAVLDIITYILAKKSSKNPDKK